MRTLNVARRWPYVKVLRLIDPVIVIAGVVIFAALLSGAYLWWSRTHRVESRLIENIDFVLFIAPTRYTFIGHKDGKEWRVKVQTWLSQHDCIARDVSPGMKPWAVIHEDTKSMRWLEIHLPPALNQEKNYCGIPHCAERRTKDPT